MPHVNHRRGETRRSVHRFQGGLTPYDERPWRITDFRYFRREENRCVERLRVGDDPEAIIWPTSCRHNDNPWNYD